MPELARDLRRFVVDNFLYGHEDGLADDDSFLERGLLDSTGVMELVAFLEARYGIHIADEELIPDNLDSINSLVRFVGKKVNGAG